MPSLAEFRLVGPNGERVVPAARLYANDGINYLTKQPDEILAAVRLPATDGWDATYHKLRRRGSFDFPVLGVAVWLRWDGRYVAAARVVLGGVGSRPQEVAEAGAALTGTDLPDESIGAAADAAYRPAKPLAPPSARSTVSRTRSKMSSTTSLCSSRHARPASVTS